MKTESADWYDTPLYYDIVFDADTSKEADFLEAVAIKHGKSGFKSSLSILEPACGSGRLITELAGRGHKVCGFDLNENMLDHAQARVRKKKLSAKLWCARLENFQLPDRRRFDLAHCLVSTFKYVSEEKGAASHLRLVGKSLRKGGLYVLGLHLTEYKRGGAEHERWSGSRGGVQVVCNTHTWPPDRKTRTEALRTRLQITRRGKTWVQETRWTFRTYDAAQLKRLIRSVPEFEHLASYDFTYDVNEPRKLDNSYADIILVLRKK